MSHLPKIHCLIVSPRARETAHTRALVADAHALGLKNIARLEKHDLYFLRGALSKKDLEKLARELFTDAVTENYHWRGAAEQEGTRRSEGNQGNKGTNRTEGTKGLGDTRYAIRDMQIIQVALRPGVTDPVAHEIVRAAHALGITNLEQAATGQQYLVRGHTGAPLAEKELHQLARRLLANDVIQHYALGEIEPTFPQDAHASGIVETIPLTELSDDELLNLSNARRAALDVNEMRAAQNYFRSLGREPIDVEFEMLAQTWSEHCVHKTFKAKISYQSSVNSNQSSVVSRQSSVSSLQSSVSMIDGILKTYLRAATEKIAAPFVRSAFVDNAGVIDFDDEYEISFKVETHNHPSAIEPFGGANTGVGGVIRDILGVSAKPIAATDVLCFGLQDVDAEKLPEGVLHPRVIRSGVVAGIQDYGNKIGIPTVGGAIYYDEGYTANPLVFCGCVGIAPKNKHPREPRARDRIIVLGGRTGRDGLRGATFSSMTMDAQTGEVAGASVQIGDPITEKGLIEVITRARDADLYHAITDCGAGGLSSAVGEMARDTGADVELKNVRLKYPGLAPWEIWLSEAQERMVMAVPPENLASLQKLCDTYGVELTDIGAFDDSGRVVVKYDGRVVLDLKNHFLHEGIPQRELKAVVSSQLSVISNQSSVISNQSSVISNQSSVISNQSSVISLQSPVSSNRERFALQRENEDFNQQLLDLLAQPNIASKADVIRMYDHEVQGGTVVKPLTGAMNDAPSDAVVLKPIGTRGTRGVVLSCGINPEYGKHDAYRMALSVIDEAIRNAVAVGADPTRIALLDNFCWGDPKRPETLGALVEAARGCYDGALLFHAPFISGKDSLNNEYLGADGQRHAIPPTLLISAVAIIDDVNDAVTMDLKRAGDVIYRVGVWQRDESFVPPLSQEAPRVYRALHRAMRGGLVCACHDLSEGGLGVSAAEMCIGGRLGMKLEIENAEMLFGETNGCLLVEVAPNDCAAFETFLREMPHAFARVGHVTKTQTLEIFCAQGKVISVKVDELAHAFNQSPVSGREP